MRMLSRLTRRPGQDPSTPTVIPADPRTAVEGPLDPVLTGLLAALGPHRQRLWARRIVRRTWLALAGIAVAELVLWTVARFIPIPWAPLAGMVIALIGTFVLLVAIVRTRPSLGETALAVDGEGHLGDRVSSALELAVAVPDSAGPVGPAATPTDDRPDVAETDRFVRRQRADALRIIRSAPPTMFKPRLSHRPAIALVLSGLLLAPVLLIPNPQDAVIAQQRQVEAAADRQANRLDELAKELDAKGADAQDPRTRLAQELRELARQLRDKPSELDANLARLGAIEADVRAQTDPANEQRAASLTSLSRALSSAATGKPDANKDGDPKKTQEDLEDLGDKLDDMTNAEKADLARQLAEMQATASQASGAAATALHDAAQSLAQGDTTGAQSALDRLGEAVTGAERQVATNRDLSSAASRLQDARRDLADAGRRRTAQGQGQGQGAGQSPGAGQGQGQGQGAGQGQGQGQGQGAIGGGGSNARSLGNGTGGNGTPAGPTNPNRPSQLGEDLRSVFAPFDRLGRPGDPSYVAGTGGDGQTQQGSQTGTGSNNGSLTPYEDVYADFYRYAQTSLERGYVPLSVKDLVRDYFSSLDPSR